MILDYMQIIEFDNVKSFEFIIVPAADVITYNLGKRYHRTPNPQNILNREEFVEKITQRLTGQIAGSEFVIGGASLADGTFLPYQVSSPAEFVEDYNQYNVKTNSVGYNEEFYYKVYHYVPNESEEFYYSEYTFQTTLSKAVTYLTAEVYEVLGKDDDENELLSSKKNNFTARLAKSLFFRQETLLVYYSVRRIFRYK